MITLQSKIKIGSRKLKIGCGKPKTGVEKPKISVEHRQTACCILKHRDRKPNEGAHRPEPTRKRAEASRSQFSSPKAQLRMRQPERQGPQQAEAAPKAQLERGSRKGKARSKQ